MDGVGLEFYLQKVVSLVFIIGMMLVTSFLVPPENLDARIQITITLFLSAVSSKPLYLSIYLSISISSIYLLIYLSIDLILSTSFQVAFNYVVQSYIPKVSYSTYLDYYFTLNYTLLGNVNSNNAIQSNPLFQSESRVVVVQTGQLNTYSHMSLSLSLSLSIYYYLFPLGLSAIEHVLVFLLDKHLSTRTSNTVDYIAIAGTYHLSIYLFSFLLSPFCFHTYIHTYIHTSSTSLCCSVFHLQLAICYHGKEKQKDNVKESCIGRSGESILFGIASRQMGLEEEE